MDFITHGLIGWLIARLWATGKVGPGAAVVAVLTAVLPDVDCVRLLASLFSFMRAPAGTLPAQEAQALAAAFTTFHAASHSLVIGLAWALVVAAVQNTLSKRKSFHTWFLVALLPFLADVLLDTLTPFGTEYLWPFWRRRFTGDLIWYVDPWITSVATLAVMFGFLEKQGPRLALWGFALIIGYLGGCAAAHQLALNRTRVESDQLPGRHHRIDALPVPFTPLVWKGFVTLPGTTYCYEWHGASGMAAVVEAHTRAIEDEWIQAARKDPLALAFCSEARFLSIRHIIPSPEGKTPNHVVEFWDLQYSDRASKPHLVLTVTMNDAQGILDESIEVSPKPEVSRDEVH